MIIAIAIILSFTVGWALGSLISYYNHIELSALLPAEDQPEPVLPAELQRLQADNARLKETADFYLGLYSETMQLRKTQ